MTVIAAVVFAVAVAGAAVYTVRRIRVGMEDAMALAAKLAVPRPKSARDWPELRVKAVIPSPTVEADFLIVADWPGRPGTVSSMVVRTAGSCQRAGRLLEVWRREGTPLSPMPWDRDGIELRPRGGTVRLQARLITEAPA